MCYYKQILDFVIEVLFGKYIELTDYACTGILFN